MTTRADMIRTAANALAEVESGTAWLDASYVGVEHQTAAYILDAVLPQITTVEQLEALPDGTLLVDDDGDDWRKRPNTVPTLDGQLLWGPLTVVWQPEAAKTS